MKVLITGISGFVGQHLAEFIFQKGNIELCGVDYRKCSFFFAPDAQHRIQIYELDLLKADQVKEVVKTIQPNWLFHLAARTNVPDSYTDQTATIMTNIIGTINLLEAVRQTGLSSCRILIPCSSDQYGRVLPQELPIKESQLFRPITPYAVSKIGQEMVAYQYFLSYGLPTIRIRAFNHTGPGQSPDFVCPAFAKQIADIEQKKQPPRILVGNLDTRRDFTDVRDIVLGYWLALEKGDAGAVYNLCSGQSYSIGEILSILLSMTSAKIEIVPDPERIRPVDVPNLVGDYTKFNLQTGWKPGISFRQTLQNLVEYYRKR